MNKSKYFVICAMLFIGCALFSQQSSNASNYIDTIDQVLNGQFHISLLDTRNDNQIIGLMTTILEQGRIMGLVSNLINALEPSEQPGMYKTYGDLFRFSMNVNNQLEYIAAVRSLYKTYPAIGSRSIFWPFSSNFVTDFRTEVQNQPTPEETE